MPLRASRPTPPVSAYRPSTPSRPASPAPALARSSSPAPSKAARPGSKQHSRFASTDSTRLRTSWGPMVMVNDFTVSTITAPLKSLHLVDGDAAPQGVTPDTRNAYAAMSLLGRPDHEQDFNLVQATNDGDTGLLDTVGMHPGDVTSHQDTRTEVQLADLLTTKTKTKRTRRQRLEHDFEIIPKIRSVIALDDQALPEPEIEEPWDVIYDHEKTGPEPSYATIAALN